MEIKNITIDELCEKVNCKAFPERWRKFYDDAMKDYRENGCPYLEPAYYEEIAKKYDMLVKYLDLYMKTAKEIKENEYLSAFFSLLCYALKDRENINEDLSNLTLPKDPENKNSLSYNMLSALAICSLAPYCYENLKKRNLPDKIINSVMRLPEIGVDEYLKRSGGVYGYIHLSWYQRAIDGNLIPVNRFEIELNTKFRAAAIVFKNSKGEYISLANNLSVHRDGYPLGSKFYEDEEGSETVNVTEDEISYKGRPLSLSGRTEKEEVTLLKSEWEKVISQDDDVVALHIPAKGKFTEDIIDSSLEEIREFMAEYFPDYGYKGFGCYSWLLSLQLEELLGENSNIVKFGKRFKRFAVKSEGLGVLYFVFNMLEAENADYSALPENTSLERSLKKHYTDGNVLYENYGIILNKNISKKYKEVIK